MAEIQASTNLRRVTFDGTTIAVRSLRGRVLRQVPIAELVAVQLKPPGRISSGSFQLYVSTRSDFRDNTAFAAKDLPAFELLHQALQTALAARPAPQLPAEPLTTNQHSVAVQPAPPAPVLVKPSSADRWLYRLKLLELGLSIVPLLIGALFTLAVLIICAWALITN